MCVSAMAMMSRLFETIVSPIRGPLFLIEQLFTKPRFIGHGLRAISPDNSSRVKRHLILACAGNLYE